MISDLYRSLPDMALLRYHAENCGASLRRAGGGTRPYVVHGLRWFSDGADEAFPFQVQDDFLSGLLRS